MRSILILSVGFLLLSAFAIFSKLFVQHYPSATNWAMYVFAAIWLIATGFNMWVGVAKAGYSIGEELPIMLLLFLLPVVAAALLKWKVL